MPEKDSPVKFIDGKSSPTSSSNEAITARINELVREAADISPEVIEGEVYKPFSVVEDVDTHRASNPERVFDLTSFSSPDGLSAARIHAGRQAKLKKAA